MRRSGTPTASMARRAVFVVVAAVALWFLAPLAAAHATLESSDPADGAVLDTPPTAVALTFGEPVQTADDAIRVFDPTGAEVDVTNVESRDVRVSADVARSASRGTFTVSWKVVSADGHPIEGAFIYSVGAPTASAPQVPASGSGSRSGWGEGLRALGVALEIGALALVLAGALTRRLGGAPVRGTQRAWAIAMAGAVLAALGAAWALDPDLSTSVRVLSRGPTGLFLGLAVLVTAVGVMVAPWRWSWVLAVVGVVVAALPGHAVSLSPVWRAATLTVLHVLAAVAWGASLLWLVQVARAVPSDTESADAEPTDAEQADAEQADAEQADAEPSDLGAPEPDATPGSVVLASDARRFSPVGMVGVVVLALTGGILLVDRTGWGDLLGSAYGRVGLVKVLLLVVAVAMAARNRWVLVPALDRGAERSVPRFAAAVRVEVMVLALALVAGTILGQMAPPASVPAGGPYSDRRSFGSGQVSLTVAPGRVGQNELHVTALTADGTLMADIQDLAVQVRQPDKGVGPLDVPVTTITAGHVTGYAPLTLDGSWKVTVTGHQGKFDSLRADFTVPIAP